MIRTEPVIRLVGGPHKLDGASYDVSASPHDQADLDGDRFVRAVRGSSVMPLAELRSRCADRATAERLAGEWGCAVFAYGRDRRLRTRYFRYQATHRLHPARDAHGAWTLAVGEVVSPVPAAERVGRTAGAPALCDDRLERAVWAMLESAVDEAAARFATVAGLLPEGPLAERAESTRAAVGTCVTDAARLCGVGLTIAPHWRPEDDSADPATRAGRLAARVASLIGTIDEATAHLVDLHLEIGDGGDPVEPVAHLLAAWTELEPRSIRVDRVTKGALSR